MKKTGYVDLDGVLCDFFRAAVAFHGKELHISQGRWNFPEQIGFSGTWAKEFWDPLGRSFWAGLPWTDEGKLLLAGLEGMFGEDMIVLTSPCETDGCVDGKLDWIKREIPAYRRRYSISPAKAEQAAPCKILVDDHDGNTDKFQAKGGLAVLVPRPWNRRRDECDGEGGFDVEAVLAEVRRLL